MKHGPYIFLGLLFALALSWLGMVATPQLQLSNQQPTNVPPSNVIYPTPYSGQANLGRDVYRANGCAYCHTQVVRQEGTRLDVVLTKAGTNEAAVVQALMQIKPGRSQAEAQSLVASAPKTVLSVATKAQADAAQKALTGADAEATVRVVPLGPDIERGWGRRVSVGSDYLYATPLMLGNVRLGPDLANIGARQTNEAWHLIHLYDPKLTSPGSTMPRYPFLFEKRARKGEPAPDSLPVPGAIDVIPTREARALATYLADLKSELPLFEAPGPALPAAVPQAPTTNAPAASTNQPSASPSVTK